MFDQCLTGMVGGGGRVRESFGGSSVKALGWRLQTGLVVMMDRCVRSWGSWGLILCHSGQGTPHVVSVDVCPSLTVSLRKTPRDSRTVRVMSSRIVESMIRRCGGLFAVCCIYLFKVLYMTLIARNSLHFSVRL